MGWSIDRCVRVSSVVRYPVAASGFRRRTVEIETSGFFTGANLLQDGERAPKGPKRGTYLLTRDDGTSAVARLKTSAFMVDPVPAMEIDGQRFHAVRPLRWYEMVWIGLPVLLIFVGGALGAVVGAVAASASATVFRSDRPAAVRYGLTGGLSILSVIVYIVLASVFLSLIGR